MRFTPMSATLAALVGCGNADLPSHSQAVISPAEPVEASVTVAIPFAQQAEPGLLTGGQPDPSHVDAAASAGFRSIVNLRAPGEAGRWDEAGRAGELGLHYVDFPIGGADVTPEKAAGLRELLAGVERPVMVHCASGNRVGALFALDAFFHGGASREEALAIGRARGLTGMEARVSGLLVK